MENKNPDYKTDHIVEVLEQVGTPKIDKEQINIEYDDSFLDIEDKKKLIEVIMDEVKNSPNNRWCDEHMIKCLAMYKYKQVIIKMDVDEYKREREQINSDPLSMIN